MTETKNRYEVEEDYLDYLPEEHRLFFHNCATRTISTDGRISIAKFVHNYVHLGVLYLVRLERTSYGTLGRQTSEGELIDRRGRDNLEDREFFQADFQTFASDDSPRIQVGNKRDNKERERVMFMGEGRYFKIVSLSKREEASEIDEETE